MQRMFKGNIGVPIDYSVSGLDLSKAVSVAFKWKGPNGRTGSLAATLYDASTIRRVTDGTEFPVPGLYTLWPDIDSPAFTGQLDPFKVQVEVAG